MGLDNGIVIKRINKDKVKNFPKFIKYEVWDRNNSNEVDIEIAYWRKCWGIRNAISNAFYTDPDDANIDLEREDLLLLIKTLYNFLSKEYWDEYSQSIWEFEESIDNLIQVIINLKWLYSYLEDNPDIEVYFYDSY